MCGSRLQIVVSRFSVISASTFTSGCPAGSVKLAFCSAAIITSVLGFSFAKIMPTFDRSVVALAGGRVVDLEDERCAGGHFERGVLGVDAHGLSRREVGDERSGAAARCRPIVVGARFAACTASSRGSCMPGAKVNGPLRTRRRGRRRSR